MSVVAASTETESRNETRRPSVSATTPVGTSKSTMPAEKHAFATNTSKKLSPAPRRKSVFTPQISAADSVYSPESVKYPTRMRRLAGGCAATSSVMREA